MMHMPIREPMIAGANTEAYDFQTRREAERM